MKSTINRTSITKNDIKLISQIKSRNSIEIIKISPAKTCNTISKKRNKHSLKKYLSKLQNT